MKGNFLVIPSNLGGLANRYIGPGTPHSITARHGTLRHSLPCLDHTFFLSTMWCCIVEIYIHLKTCSATLGVFTNLSSWDYFFIWDPSSIKRLWWENWFVRSTISKNNKKQKFKMFKLQMKALIATLVPLKVLMCKKHFIFCRHLFLSVAKANV